MSWYETLAWLGLALLLEKLLDYAVWPRWLRRKRAKRGMKLKVISKSKPSAQTPKTS